jgi:hypothetical protein
VRVRKSQDSRINTYTEKPALANIPHELPTMARTARTATRLAMELKKGGLGGNGTTKISCSYRVPPRMTMAKTRCSNKRVNRS